MPPLGSPAPPPPPPPRCPPPPALLISGGAVGIGPGRWPSGSRLTSATVGTMIGFGGLGLLTKFPCPSDNGKTATCMFASSCQSSRVRRCDRIRPTEWHRRQV